MVELGQGANLSIEASAGRVIVELGARGEQLDRDHVAGVGDRAVDVRRSTLANALV
jgi:hypothetical protein